jgi:formylglycine-generating enzyme required for sulfatase activity
LQAWSSQTVVQFRKVEIKRLPPTFAVAPFDAAQAKHYQDGWAKHLGLPVETTNSLGMQLRLVPPGEFLMGSLDSDKSALPMEKPQHKVRLGKPFYAGVHEVTVAQFRAFVEATAYQTDAEREDAGSWHFIDIPQKGRNTAWTWKTPGFEQTDRHPVCCVTGHDADRFCTWLSVKEGEHYRLPSEAEWEYACGAGTTTPYHFGTEMDLDQMRMVSTTGSAAVGSYAPNAFGLCDTHGNVFEWCFDGRRSYKSAPLIVDPLGPVGPEIPRVVRGGGWTSSKKLATGRTTARLVTCTPDRPFHGLGFRVVRVIDPVEATEAFAPASAVEPENVR